MGVIMLTSDNFAVQDGGRKMVIDIDGVVVVFFRSTNCPHCRQFMQAFNQVANRDSRLQFGCIDINMGNNRKVVQMSKNTKTKIAAVPYVVLYQSGRPFSVYKGDKNPQAFMSFIDRMLEKTMQSDGPNGGMSSVSRGYMNQQPPIASSSATMGGPAAPIDNKQARPSVPDGVTKIPRNKPYLELVYDK